MSTAIDMIGQTFGKLTVIEDAGADKHKQKIWLCECDCGNTTIVTGYALRKGHTRSCGCLIRPGYSAKGRYTVKAGTESSSYKHGSSNSKLYKAWSDMKSRCNNQNHRSYHNYGARGIRVCDEWSENYQTFYEDVSELPYFNEPGYSLDRIDNDGNYEPGNVRWADRVTQLNNKRSNKRISYKGETHTAAEWMRILGIKK